MKSLLVVLLVVVAAESRQVCIPNTRFMQFCNTCFCTADGTSVGCTLMACDENVWNFDGTKKHHSYLDDTIKIVKRSTSIGKSVFDKKCEPGKSFKYYCNTCTCTRLGNVGRCTRMLCDEGIYNEDGTLKINRNDKKCERGKAYSPDGCSTCICNEYGTGTICTNKTCLSNLIEIHTDKKTKKWGPLYKQGDNCIPEESFYSQCNQCVCSRNGKNALCTLMICST